ncbi:T-cell receptor-associated transmembrane adapter 1 [Spea bombifrons]|uniref:T-cell receptor-associated transmembrane adapter 1 n=1 Tax=Spea bombifrons TaxID=233779 RepID=UPI0023493DDB|nr:T-cell receptor-associated transmembrane adapter 1 [Spea bombifrons]
MNAMLEGQTGDCTQLWASLAVMCPMMILSLTFNIVNCVKKNRKGKQLKYSDHCSMSYERYIENNPIYGNLNQPILEYIDSLVAIKTTFLLTNCSSSSSKYIDSNIFIYSFKENVDEISSGQMSNDPVINREERKLKSQETMCYATLDLSSTRPKKKQTKTKTRPINPEEYVEKISSGNIYVNTNIYLNMNQLIAGNETEVETIHKDPMQIQRRLQKIRNNMARELNSQTD